MSSPSIVTRPDVGGRAPAITLKSVVLPAPFGPIEPGDRALGDLKRRAVNGTEAAEMLVQVLDPDHACPSLVPVCGVPQRQCTTLDNGGAGSPRRRPDTISCDSAERTISAPSLTSYLGGRSPRTRPAPISSTPVAPTVVDIAAGCDDLERLAEFARQDLLARGVGHVHDLVLVDRPARSSRPPAMASSDQRRRVIGFAARRPRCRRCRCRWHLGVLRRAFAVGARARADGSR